MLGEVVDGENKVGFEKHRTSGAGLKEESESRNSFS